MFLIPIQQAFAVQQVRRRGPNVQRVAAETGERTESHMRLSQNEINNLAAEYDDWRLHRFNLTMTHMATSIRRVEAFLRYLSSGGFYRQTAFPSGVATSTVHLYTHEVADFLTDMAPHSIHLPHLNELPHISKDLLLVNGQRKRIVLYIDGCIVPIQRPSHAGNAFFCGRMGKSCDAINVQYIVDENGMVRHIVTGAPGATHDKTAVEWSDELLQFLQNLPEPYRVIGDAAYRGYHDNVLVPYTGQGLAQEQLQFNDRFSRLRQIVERAIGATEIKWRMNQLKENRFPAKEDTDFASKCTIATAVLHNRYTNYI